MTVISLRSPLEPEPPVVLDDRRHLVDAVSALLLTELQDLREVTQREPATYLIGYRGPLELYRPLLTNPGTSCFAELGWPIYAGSTRSIRERTQRHLLNLNGCQVVAPGDLRVAVLRVESLAAAAYLEALVISEMKPVWCERWLRGFGSAATQGRHRSSQAVSPWDTLHPGRHLSASRLVHDRTTLRQRVVEHLESSVPAVARRLERPTAAAHDTELSR
jgi:hypothetical protein